MQMQSMSLETSMDVAQEVVSIPASLAPRRRTMYSSLKTMRYHCKMEKKLSCTSKRSATFEKQDKKGEEKGIGLSSLCRACPTIAMATVKTVIRGRQRSWWVGSVKPLRNAQLEALLRVRT
jgi:hypothetical protein